MKKDGRWIAKRIRVNALIDQVSEIYGGDDEEWLNEYKSEVLAKYADNLKVAYDCFKSLIPVGYSGKSKSCDTNQISSLYRDCCGLRKPMCKCNGSL